MGNAFHRRHSLLWRKIRMLGASVPVCEYINHCASRRARKLAQMSSKVVQYSWYTRQATVAAQDALRVAPPRVGGEEAGRVRGRGRAAGSGQACVDWGAHSAAENVVWCGPLAR